MKAKVTLEFTVEVEIDDENLKEIVTSYRSIVDSSAYSEDVISEIARQRVIYTFEHPLFVEGVGEEGELFKVTEDTEPFINVTYEEETSEDFNEWEQENS